MSYTCNIAFTNHTLIKNNEIDKVLANLQRNRSSNLIFPCLSFNSIRTKPDDLRHIINGNIDIL